MNQFQGVITRVNVVPAKGIMPLHGMKIDGSVNVLCLTINAKVFFTADIVPDVTRNLNQIQLGSSEFVARALHSLFLNPQDWARFVGQVQSVMQIIPDNPNRQHELAFQNNSGTLMLPTVGKCLGSDMPDRFREFNIPSCLKLEFNTTGKPILLVKGFATYVLQSMFSEQWKPSSDGMMQVADILRYNVPSKLVGQITASMSRLSR